VSPAQLPEQVSADDRRFDSDRAVDLRRIPRHLATTTARFRSHPDAAASWGSTAEVDTAAMDDQQHLIERHPVRAIEQGSYRIALGTSGRAVESHSKFSTC
jgi:hypothetical protein